jgi:vancomycin permeability regulator SanA
MKRVLLASLLVAAFIFAATKVAFRLAEVSGPRPSSEHGCAVLVLGYPTNADGTFSPVERFRVEAGVHVYREHGCSKLVLSGAAVQNEHVEADSMAVLAKHLGVPSEDIVLERMARSTWENVGCTARLLPSTAPVLVVSDSLHASRAARYACRQDPGLCERFLATGVAPPIDAFWSVVVAANELRVFVRDFLLYRSGAVENSPSCNSREEPSV